LDDFGLGRSAAFLGGGIDRLRLALAFLFAASAFGGSEPPQRGLHSLKRVAGGTVSELRKLHRAA
jgi:hypothetical protein